MEINNNLDHFAISQPKTLNRVTRSKVISTDDFTEESHSYNIEESPDKEASPAYIIEESPSYITEASPDTETATTSKSCISIRHCSVSLDTGDISNQDCSVSSDINDITNQQTASTSSPHQIGSSFDLVSDSPDNSFTVDEMLNFAKNKKFPKKKVHNRIKIL